MSNFILYSREKPLRTLLIINITLDKFLLAIDVYQFLYNSTFYLLIIVNKYFDYISDSYSKSRALVNIALEIGKEYNDITTSLSYLDKINIDTESPFIKCLVSGVYLNLGILDKAWKYYKFRNHREGYKFLKKDFDINKEWNGQNIEGKKLYIITLPRSPCCPLIAGFLQFFLCDFQSVFWQSALQYRATLHREQVFVASNTVQLVL